MTGPGPGPAVGPVRWSPPIVGPTRLWLRPVRARFSAREAPIGAGVGQCEADQAKGRRSLGPIRSFLRLLSQGGLATWSVSHLQCGNVRLAIRLLVEKLAWHAAHGANMAVNGGLVLLGPGMGWLGRRRAVLVWLWLGRFGAMIRSAHRKTRCQTQCRLWRQSAILVHWCDSEPECRATLARL